MPLGIRKQSLAQPGLHQCRPSLSVMPAAVQQQGRVIPQAACSTGAQLLQMMRKRFPFARQRNMRRACGRFMKELSLCSTPFTSSLQAGL